MYFAGAVHGEDMFYLHRLNEFLGDFDPNDEAYMIRERQVRLITNFIKYGDPTPDAMDPLIPFKWHPTKKDEFMNIGRFLTMQDNPSPDRMSVWIKFEEEFGALRGGK